MSLFRLVPSPSPASCADPCRAARRSWAAFPRARDVAATLAAAALSLLVAACAPKVAAPEGEGQAGAPQPGPGPVTGTMPAPAMPELPAEQQAMEVGLLLPLSGPNAALGQSLLRAAEMALFDLGDDRFTLVVRDTQALGGALGAAQQLVQEDVRIVLGPIFSAEVTQAAPAVRAAGVPMVAFSTDVTVAGNGVYVMGVLPSLQVDRVVGYATSQGVRRMAALAPASAFGQAVVAALQLAAPRFGAAVGQVQFYDPAAADLSSTVQSMNPGGSPQFDALLLPEGAPRLNAIAPLLPYYDIDTTQVRLLGTALWDDPALGREPALVGGWFAAPQPEQWQSFARRYRGLHGTEPPRIASLAYDAAALAAVLGREGGAGFAPDAITSPSGFAGVDGVFRLLPDGRVERGLAVFEMQAGGPVVIDPAPQSFEPTVF